MTGFTLVELLVVVAIIVILAGLVSVGVNSARSSARRMQCQNNQRQIGVALKTFENKTKGRLPGLRETKAGVTMSWAGWLLPYIEENGKYDEIMNRMYRVDVTVRQGYSPKGNIPVFVCSVSNIDNELPLSYVVNCGPCKPYNSQRPSMPLTNHDEDKAFLFSVNITKRCDVSEIPDGTSKTVLLSENLWACSWWCDPVWGDTKYTVDKSKTYIGVVLSIIADTGFVWNGNFNNRDNGGYKLYKPNNPKLRANSRSAGVGELRVLFVPPTQNEEAYGCAIPSSNHPGQFCVLYADGHVEVMNDDIEPEVYIKAVCPNDKLLDKTKANGGFRDDWQ
jgi:prepilin-type N-terminal cleavage/methylation domain-containing protein/prepilin-type processing-associated H-X9-DG protein